MRYLVTGSEGPGFASPEETIGVLEKIVIPSFDALTALESKKVVLVEESRHRMRYLPIGEGGG